LPFRPIKKLFIVPWTKIGDKFDVRAFAGPETGMAWHGLSWKIARLDRETRRFRQDPGAAYLFLLLQ